MNILNRSITKDIFKVGITERYYLKQLRFILDKLIYKRLFNLNKHSNIEFILRLFINSN